MASGDAQQQQSPPPPAQIVVPVDYVKQMIGQFYTCTQPCEEGSPQVPVADDVQEKMINAIASMATVLVNAYSQAAATERTPSETQQTTDSTSAGLSGGVTATPAGATPTVGMKVESGTSETNTVTRDSTSAIVRNVEVQNTAIQANLAVSLLNMPSPVAAQQGTPLLGQVPTVWGMNGASLLADLARTRANDVAQRFYRTTLNRPLPNAFRYKTFGQELFLGYPRH